MLLPLKGGKLNIAFGNWTKRPVNTEAESLLELEVDDSQDLIKDENLIKEVAIKRTEEKTGRSVMRSNKTFELMKFQYKQAGMS